MIKRKRLGLVGYLNFTGLGAMNQEFLNQFEFDCHLVIPGEDKGHYPHLANSRSVVESPSWKPPDDMIAEFLMRVDVVVMIETDFKCGLIEKAKRAGKKVVFVPMWEWFDPKRLSGADVYLCTSKKTFQVLKDDGFENSIFLPWPVDTNRFKFKRRGEAPNMVFVHNAGFGGMNWRKGTLEAVAAFRRLQEPEATLVLRSQRPIERYPREVTKAIEDDSRIVVDGAFYDDSAKMYKDGDVYLYPARYDGQALVAEEALACGYPTFVTDAPPMNEFKMRDWMGVDVRTNDPVQIYGRDVPLNVCSIADLTRKMERAVRTDLTRISEDGRKYIEKEYSWKRWRREYETVLRG